jgi:hypothetical protein
MAEKPFALISLLLLAVVLPGGASPATSQLPTPPVSVVAQPSDGGVVYYERIAAAAEGVPDTWFLSADVTIRNTGSQTLRPLAVELVYPGTQLPPIRTSLASGDKREWIQSGKQKTIRLVDTRRYPVPGPKNFAAKFTFSGFTLPFIVQRGLAEWKSKAPNGYLFPARKEDLKDGEYWLDDETHFPGSGHYGTASQRFAYDLKVFRWNGSKWTHLESGKDGSKNENYVVWDLPVYAMADGWVLKCTRGVEDNAIGVKGTAGGNGYRIVHATGETAVYAHLRAGTVKPRLCPQSGVTFRANEIRISAGQELGRVGNTGSSTNPHLHVHIATGDGTVDGRPTHFRRIRTLFAGQSLNRNAPCQSGNQSFVTATGAAAGPSQLIDPLLLPGHGEYARHRIDDACARELLGAISAAGYSIAWLDGFDAGGKTYFNVVYRKSGPSWLYRFGLTTSQFQTQLEQAVADGYRPTHVESYLRGGQRFAFVAEKRGGPDYRVYHDRSASSHAQLTNQLDAQGLRPVNVSVVSIGGSRRYTALWERRNAGSWKLSSTVRLGDYQGWLAAEASAGRRLSYVNAYAHGGTTFLSAIVSSAVSPAYQARHGLTSSQYEDEYEKWVAAGLSTRAVTAYLDRGVVRFAALWR